MAVYNMSKIKEWYDDFNSCKSSYLNNYYQTYKSSYVVTNSDSTVSKMHKKLDVYYSKLKRAYSKVGTQWKNFYNDLMNADAALAGQKSSGSINASSAYARISAMPKLVEYKNDLGLTGAIGVSGVSVSAVAGVTYGTEQLQSDTIQTAASNSQAGAQAVSQSVSKTTEASKSGIGKTLGMAATGAATGAAVASVIPGVGTLVGAVIGGITGAVIGSGVVSKVKDWVVSAGQTIKETAVEVKEKINSIADEVEETDGASNKLKVVGQGAKEVGKKVGATISTIGISAVEGLAKLVEDVADLAALVGTAVTSVGTGLTDLANLAGAKITGDDSYKSDYTKRMWEKARSHVATDHVGNIFDKFYDNTPAGKKIKENAIAFDTTRAVTREVSEVLGVIGITILTAGVGGAVTGTATSVGAGISAAAASTAVTTTGAAITYGAVKTAEHTETNWQDENTSTFKGLAKGVLQGVADGAFFAIGAKGDNALRESATSVAKNLGKDATKEAIKAAQRDVTRKLGMKMAFEGATSVAQDFGTIGLDAIFSNDTVVDANGNTIKLNSMSEKLKYYYEQAGGAQGLAQSVMTAIALSAIADRSDSIKIVNKAVKQGEKTSFKQALHSSKLKTSYKIDQLKASANLRITKSKITTANKAVNLGLALRNFSGDTISKVKNKLDASAVKQKISDSVSGVKSKININNKIYDNFKIVMKNDIADNSEALDSIVTNFKLQEMNGNKECSKVLKKISEIKQKNQNFNIFSSKTASSYMINFKAISVGKVSDEGTNFPAFCHELGHGLFDLSLNRKLPDNWSDIADIARKKSSQSTKFVEIQNKFKSINNEISNKTKQEFELKYKCKANDYPNKIIDKYSTNKEAAINDLKKYIENKTTFKVDQIEKVQGDLSTKSPRELATIETNLKIMALKNKISNNNYCDFDAISDIIDAVYKGSDVDLNGNGIYLKAKHGKNYYTNGAAGFKKISEIDSDKLQFDEIIANFTQLKLSGKESSLKTLKDIFGEEFYNTVDNVYKNMTKPTSNSGLKLNNRILTGKAVNLKQAIKNTTGENLSKVKNKINSTAIKQKISNSASSTKSKLATTKKVVGGVSSNIAEYSKAKLKNVNLKFKNSISNTKFKLSSGVTTLSGTAISLKNKLDGSTVKQKISDSVSSTKNKISTAKKAVGSVIEYSKNRIKNSLNNTKFKLSSRIATLSGTAINLKNKLKASIDDTANKINVNKQSKNNSLRGFMDSNNQYQSQRNIYLNNRYYGIEKMDISASRNILLKYKDSCNIIYWTGRNQLYPNDINFNTSSASEYAFMNFQIGVEPEVPLRNSYKIYLPTEGDFSVSNMDDVLGYMIKNNIASDNKIYKTTATDGICLRVYDVNQAIDVINYINNNSNIRVSATPSPFAKQIGKVAVAMDGCLSYNSCATTAYSNYLKFTNKPTPNGFKNYLKQIKSKVDSGNFEFLNYLTENGIAPSASSYANYYQVLESMIAATDNNSSLNDYFKILNQHQNTESYNQLLQTIQFYTNLK